MHLVATAEHAEPVADTGQYSRARTFARRGWPVFPCEPFGKKPAGHLVPHGVLEATTDENQIRRWWAEEPEANIGIATGDPSGFFAVDLDVTHADGLATWASLTADRGTPRTATVITPTSGRHLYFSMPSGVSVRNSAGQLGPGVDVRGSGGYVVAAGSQRPEGVYRWDGMSVVAEPPKWLIDLLTEDKPAVASQAVSGAIPKGQRNETLVSMAGSMRRKGFTELAIVAALLVDNRRCDPPLPGNEVRAIAKSVGRYAPEQAGSELASIPQFTLLTVADILNAPAPNFLHDKPFVCEGGQSGVFGKDGCGKTQFATLLALATSAGKTIAGITPTRQGAVVYHDGERSFGVRLRAAAHAYGIDLASQPIYSIGNELLDLFDPASVREYIRFVKDAGINPLFIVIDTQALHANCDENSPEMNTVVRHQAEIGRALNCARLNITHPSKADPDNPRGHNSVRGNCDVMLKVENSDGLVTVSVDKSRFSVSGESFTYRMTSVPEIDKGVTLRPADQVIPEIPARWAPDQAQAIAALRAVAPALHKDWRASLEALGWTPSKAKRIITTLAPLTKNGDRYDVSIIDSGSPMVRS